MAVEVPAPEPQAVAGGKAPGDLGLLPPRSPPGPRVRADRTQLAQAGGQVAGQLTLALLRVADVPVAVEGDLVAVGVHRLDQVAVHHRVRGDDEERRPGAGLPQLEQQLLGPQRIGAVVIGEGDRAPHPSSGPLACSIRSSLGRAREGDPPWRRCRLDACGDALPGELRKNTATAEYPNPGNLILLFVRTHEGLGSDT